LDKSTSSFSTIIFDLQNNYWDACKPGTWTIVSGSVLVTQLMNFIKVAAQMGQTGHFNKHEVIMES